jgi:hypothetical protein
MLVALALVLLACSGEAPAPPPAAPPPPPPAEKIDPAAATAAAESRALAPSPEETRKVTQRAGISTDLATLVPERALDLDATNKDVLAVRTGVYLSDTVLTVREAKKEDLVLRLETVKKGLEGMGAGAGLLATLSSLTDRLRNDAITRDELLTELDGLVGMAVPGEGVGPDDRTGPLLQAGAWVATTNLVAKAVLHSGKLDAADTLLRQKAVVDWFRGYLKGEGAGKAEAELLAKLDATLAALGDIAAKEHLTEDDVKTVEAKTGEILSLM